MKIFHFPFFPLIKYGLRNTSNATASLYLIPKGRSRFAWERFIQTQKHLWLEMRRMHGHTQRLFFVEYGLTVVCQIFNDAALKVIVQQDITHFNH